MVYGKNNYGELYFKSADLKNLNITGSSAQKVYSLIPSSYSYDNDDGLCASISLFITKKFFESSSFLEFSKILSGLQKELAEGVKTTSSIFRKIGFGSSLYLDSNKIFKKYSHTAKIVNGDNIYLEIMKQALTLGEKQKSTIILVIGNHSVSIVMEKNQEKIHIGYYDSNFGQLYFQKVTVDDITQALNGKDFSFTHPMSILNPNSILLGKILFWRDDLIPMNIALAFMSFITDKAPLAGEVSKIEFADNLSSKTAIKHFIYNIGMFKNIAYATSNEAFEAFKGKHYKSIVKELKNFEICATIMANDFELFREMITPLYQITQDFKNNLLNQQSRNEATPNYSPENICVKEASNYKNILKAEKKLFKVTYEQKSALSEAMSKCMSTSSTVERVIIENMVKEKFDSEESQIEYSNARNDYYKARDFVRDSQTPEKCFNYTVSREIIGQLEIPQMYEIIANALS